MTTINPQFIIHQHGGNLQAKQEIKVLELNDLGLRDVLRTALHLAQGQPNVLHQINRMLFNVAAEEYGDERQAAIALGIDTKWDVYDLRGLLRCLLDMMRGEDKVMDKITRAIKELALTEYGSQAMAAQALGISPRMMSYHKTKLLKGESNESRNTDAVAGA